MLASILENVPFAFKNNVYSAVVVWMFCRCLIDQVVLIELFRLFCFLVDLLPVCSIMKTIIAQVFFTLFPPFFLIFGAMWLGAYMFIITIFS